MAGYQWVPCHHFQLPPNAISCGNDLDGQTIYLGKTRYEGDELPCKVVPGRREAYICFNGNEVCVHSFEVLVQQTMCWVPSHNGHVPHGAVPAGRTRSGEVLYAGRTRIGNSTVVGKVHPSHGCLYVPYAGKEVPHKSYEVLVYH